jgi:hypothetical protein
VETESPGLEPPEEVEATAARPSLMGLPTVTLIFGIVFVILTALWEFEINRENPGRHAQGQPELRAPEQTI